jgi:hypothetical protein
MEPMTWKFLFCVITGIVMSIICIVLRSTGRSAVVRWSNLLKSMDGSTSSHVATDYHRPINLIHGMDHSLYNSMVDNLWYGPCYVCFNGRGKQQLAGLTSNSCSIFIFFLQHRILPITSDTSLVV